MKEVQNYQCPNCTAGLSFDSETQRMVCEYCGSSFSIEELEAMLQEKEQQEQPGCQKKEQQEEAQGQRTDLSGMQAWNCPSCGAEIIAEETTAAMKCPYCDNPTVIPEQLEGLYAPDFIIPFKKSKKQAVNQLKKHYKGKLFLPKVFQDENHIKEIKGIYVPFWLFDLEASGDFSMEGVQTSTYQRGEYQYVEERFYQVIRSGNMKFLKIPVDGSRQIKDEQMEAIEPYSYEDLVPFQSSYLSGYLANKYDVKPEELEERVMQRMSSSVKSYFQRTCTEYDRIRVLQEEIHVTEKGKIQYGLFPVWFLNTRWKGENYSFVMNGQTGKMIGDLPLDGKLMAKYWIKWHVILTSAMVAVMVLLRFLGVM